MNTLKTKLAAGEAVHGCWVNSGAAINTEIVGKAGFDWVTIDFEHGVGTEDSLLDQLHALNGTSTVPIVRVPAIVRQRISRLLDLGTKGILFPLIKTPQQAEEAVSYMRYPPYGVRGMATMTRATDFGQSFENYFQGHKDEVIGIIQIETLDCLDHLDDIANVEGVDVLFVGPADLTLALGIFKQFDHPKYIEALKKVYEAAHRAGKATGTLMSSPEEYDKYYGLGFRMLGCGSDSVFVSRGAHAMVKALNDQKIKSKK